MILLGSKNCCVFGLILLLIFNWTALGNHISYQAHSDISKALYTNLLRDLEYKQLMQPYPGLLFTKAADGKCSINHFTGDLWGTLQNKFKNTVSSGHFYTFLMHNKQLSRRCYTTDKPSSLYREETCDSHYPQHDVCSYRAMAFLVFYQWTYQTFEGRIQSVSGLHLL